MLAPQWAEILHRVYGVTAGHAIVKDADNSVLGVSLFYHQARKGRRLYTGPHGIFAQTQLAQNELIGALTEYAEVQGLGSLDLVVWPDAPEGNAMAPQTADITEYAGSLPEGLRAHRHWQRSNFILPLGTDQDDFWNGLPSKARNTVRKAQKSQYVIEFTE
ncbi:MAG: hypothetical protein AAFO79_08535, partial [Pseudomonadota bacterium]